MDRTGSAPMSSEAHLDPIRPAAPSSAGGLPELTKLRMETSMIAATRSSGFSEWAACSPSCRSLPVMPDRRVLGIREFDRADAHGSVEPLLDRDGENEFALGRRPLSPWAPYPFPVTPSRASMSTPRRRSRVAEPSSAVTGNQSGILLREAA